MFDFLFSVYLLVHVQQVLGHVALAEVELLVALPAEVLRANVAVVRLGALSIHGVRRVALRTPHAFAHGQRQSLALSLVLVLTLADHAVLVGAHQAVRHPLLLVHELQVAFPKAALAVFIHVFDVFDFLLVLLDRQVEQGKQNVNRNDVLAPLLRLALHHVNRDLGSLDKFVLDRQGDLVFDAVNAGVVHANVR